MSTVLLVEDDPWYAAQQQRVLGAAGYATQWATDPQQAAELLDEYSVDAVVLDVLLTYNTAFTLLHELQSNTETAQLPVVLYSGQADTLRGISLEQYGVVALLDKAEMQPADTAKALKKAGV